MLILWFLFFHRRFCQCKFLVFCLYKNRWVQLFVIFCNSICRKVRIRNFWYLRVDQTIWKSTVPEIIDLVFPKTRPKRSFSMTEYERFGLFSRKRGSINSGTVVFQLPTHFTHVTEINLFSALWTLAICVKNDAFFRHRLFNTEKTWFTKNWCSDPVRLRASFCLFLIYISSKTTDVHSG